MTSIVFDQYDWRSFVLVERTCAESAPLVPNGAGGCACPYGSVSTARLQPAGETPRCVKLSVLLPAALLPFAAVATLVVVLMLRRRAAWVCLPPRAQPHLSLLPSSIFLVLLSCKPSLLPFLSHISFLALALPPRIELSEV
jgi:hypothetical protein